MCVCVCVYDSNTFFKMSSTFSLFPDASCLFFPHTVEIH